MTSPDPFRLFQQANPHYAQLTLSSLDAAGRRAFGEYLVNSSGNQDTDAAADTNADETMETDEVDNAEKKGQPPVLTNRLLHFVNQKPEYREIVEAAAIKGSTTNTSTTKVLLLEHKEVWDALQSSRPKQESLKGKLSILDVSEIALRKDAINAYIGETNEYLSAFLNEKEEVVRNIYRCATSHQTQGQQPLAYKVTGLRYVTVEDITGQWCPEKLLVVSLQSGDTTVWFTPLYWIVDLFSLRSGFDFSNTPWDLKHGIAKAPRWKRTLNHSYFQDHKKYSVSKNSGSDLLLRLAFRESVNMSEVRQNSLKSCVLVQVSLDRSGTRITYTNLEILLNDFAQVYGQALMEEVKGSEIEATVAAGGDDDSGDESVSTAATVKPTLEVTVTHNDMYNVFDGWKGLLDVTNTFPEKEAKELLNHVRSLESQVAKILGVVLDQNSDNCKWSHIQESLPALMKAVKDDYHIKKFCDELKLLLGPGSQRYDDGPEAVFSAGSYRGTLDLGSSKSLERPMSDIKQMGKFYVAMSAPDSNTSGIEIQEPGLIALLLTQNIDHFITAWANLSRYVIGNKVDTVKSKLQVQRHLIAAINYLVRRLDNTNTSTSKACIDELLRRSEVSIGRITQTMEGLKNEMRMDCRRHAGSHHIPDVLGTGASFNFKAAMPLYCEVRREVFASYMRFGGRFQGTDAQVEKPLRRLGHMTVMTLFGYDTRLERYVNPEFGLNVFTQGYIKGRDDCPDRWLVQTFKKHCKQVWEQATTHVRQHDEWLKDKLQQYHDAYGHYVEQYLVCYVAISSKISGPTKVAEGNLEPYGIFQSLRIHDLAAFMYVAFCDGAKDMDFVKGYLEMRREHDKPHDFRDALAAYKYMQQRDQSPVDCIVRYYAKEDHDLIESEEDIGKHEKVHRRFCMMKNATCLDPKKGRSRCVNHTLRTIVRDYADKVCKELGKKADELSLHKPLKLHVVAYRHTICDKFREVIEDSKTPEWLTKEFRGTQNFNKEWLDERLRKMFNHTLSTNTYYLVRYKIFQQYPIRMFFDCGMDIKLAEEVCGELGLPEFENLGKNLRGFVDNKCDKENCDDEEEEIVKMISEWEPPAERFLNIGNYRVKQLTIDDGQYESGIVTAIYDEDGNEEEVELPLETVLRAIRPRERPRTGKKKRPRLVLEAESFSAAAGKGKQKRRRQSPPQSTTASSAECVLENCDFSIKYVGGGPPANVFTYSHGKTSPDVHYYRGAIVNPQDGSREKKVVQVWGHHKIADCEDRYEAVLVVEGSVTDVEDLNTFLEDNNLEFGSKGDVHTMFMSSCGIKISPPFEHMSWDNVPYHCRVTEGRRTRGSEQGQNDISHWTQVSFMP